MTPPSPSTKRSAHTVFVGLGSNIDPETNLRAAAKRLRELFPTIIFSSVYRTAPLHEEEQPAFLNAVARFKTGERPEAALEGLQHIERELRKNPPFRFGPRTIDLDLLLYNNRTVNIPDRQLIIPHPRMHERRFVLEPLCELVDKTGRHPVLGGTWGELLKETGKQECKYMSLTL